MSAGIQRAKDRRLGLWPVLALLLGLLLSGPAHVVVHELSAHATLRKTAPSATGCAEGTASTGVVTRAEPASGTEARPAGAGPFCVELAHSELTPTHGQDVCPFCAQGDPDPLWWEADRSREVAAGPGRPEPRTARPLDEQGTLSLARGPPAEAFVS